VTDSAEEDPRRLVADGYDRIGDRYGRHASISRTAEREHYLQVLFDLVPRGSPTLDVGCGNGIPMTVRLAERYEVTGIDISNRQVERARRNVPLARFICSDMVSADLPGRSFNGVFAAYSIIHVPRELHAGLLQAFHGWLKPGGALVATMSAKGRETDYSRDWLGAPMFWSGFHADENRDLVAAAGFRILSAQEETVVEAEAGWGPITFLWVVAKALPGFRCVRGRRAARSGR